MSKAKYKLEAIARDILYRSDDLNMDVTDTSVSIRISKKYTGDGYSFLFDKQLATKVIKDAAANYAVADVDTVIYPNDVKIDIRTNCGFMDDRPVITVELEYGRRAKTKTNADIFGGFFDGII